jgi:hypothetical protein
MTADSQAVKAFALAAADRRGRISYCCGGHSLGDEMSRGVPWEGANPHLGRIAWGVSSPPPAPRPEVPMHYLAFAFLTLAATVYVVSSTGFG